MDKKSKRTIQSVVMSIHKLWMLFKTFCINMTADIFRGKEANTWICVDKPSPAPWY